eukprot:gene8358-9816_t
MSRLSLYLNFQAQAYWRSVKRYVGVDEVTCPDDITLRWLQARMADYYGSKTMVPQSFVLGDKLPGGMTGDIVRIELEWSERAIQEAHTKNIVLPPSIVMKCVGNTFKSHVSALALGMGREGIFYSEQASFRAQFVPVTYYATGSLEYGTFVVLMEDLSKGCFNLCRLLGNQCWGDANIPPAIAARFDSVEAISTVFRRIADFHAHFWQERALLDRPWLKNTNWLQGNDQAKWEEGLTQIMPKWASLVTSGAGITWSQLFVDTGNSMLARSSWNAYRNIVNIDTPTTAFTLTHGDYHAGNMLWNTSLVDGNTEDTPFYLVDWSEVGVGCPFTELSQFMISNVPTDIRRSYELNLFRIYWERLVELGVSTEYFQFDICYERYILGGIERWIQLFALMGASIPPNAVQYFHDQIADFILDHIESVDQEKLVTITSYNLPNTINKDTIY